MIFPWIVKAHRHIHVDNLIKWSKDVKTSYFGYAVPRIWVGIWPFVVISSYIPPYQGYGGHFTIQVISHYYVILAKGRQVNKLYESWIIITILASDFTNFYFFQGIRRITNQALFETHGLSKTVERTGLPRIDRIDLGVEPLQTSEHDSHIYIYTV